MFAKCLLRRFDCSLGEGIVLLFVVMASCVSGVSVNVLLRLCMCLQSLEGLVLYVIVLRSCFHLICCSCWISCISLLSVFILLMISPLPPFYNLINYIKKLCSFLIAHIEAKAGLAPSFNLFHARRQILHFRNISPSFSGVTSTL